MVERSLNIGQCFSDVMAIGGGEPHQGVRIYTILSFMRAFGALLIALVVGFFLLCRHKTIACRRCAQQLSARRVVERIDGVVYAATVVGGRFSGSGAMRCRGGTPNFAVKMFSNSFSTASLGVLKRRSLES